MNTIWLISYFVLWVLVLFLGFLLLGMLRSVGLLSWRLEQLEAITPRRVGRDGLKRGTVAPDFTLPSVDGKEVALHAFAGRKVLLVFTQTGCSPCHAIVPELTRLQRKGEFQVLVVNNSDLEASRQWARATGAQFPVLIQDSWKVSRRYQVFATPFTFLIDGQGLIVSKGIINNRQHIEYVLSGARDGAKTEQFEVEVAGAERGAS